MNSKSPWVLNLLYVNPEDHRILVPYPFKLGYSFNFGNPRAIQLFSWTILLVLIAILAVPSIIHQQYILENHTIFPWILFSCFSAFMILFFNGFDKSLIWRELPRFSFGFLAVAIGFGGQSIVNGALVSVIGVGNLTWIHHLILAPVAAIFQTLGKVLIVLFLVRIFGQLNDHKYIVYALILGFGFAVSEIMYIGAQVIISEQAMTGYLGVWERATSSMFHIYSAGLLAIGLRAKKYSLIVLVISIHAVTDFIAGVAGSIPVSIYTLESVFSLCAIFIWFIFLVSVNRWKSVINNRT